MEIQLTPVKKENRFNSDYYVEGYATTFTPYLLYHDLEDGDVYERIDRNAFQNAEMSDVIFQFDHAGRVFARTSNDTVYLEVDDRGLFVAADLSKTENARNLWEDINTGMITKMSWRFTIADHGQTFDPSTNTISINRVSKVFDVSAVSIPANQGTSISARGKEFVKSWKDEKRKQHTDKVKELLLKLE